MSGIHDSSPLIQRAHAQLVGCNVIASLHGIEPVSIHFMLNSRFTRRLGDALLTWPEERLGRVRFCQRLLLEWPDDQVAETYTHEIAHIFAGLDGARGHDLIWRTYMKLFGYEDARATVSVCKKGHQ